MDFGWHNVQDSDLNVFKIICSGKGVEFIVKFMEILD